MLREQHVVPPKKEPPLSEQQRLIKDYEHYLLEERGLAPATVTYNVRFADQFVSAFHAKFEKHLNFSQLRAEDVTDFVWRQSHMLSPGRVQLLCTGLRSFLRSRFQRFVDRSHGKLCLHTHCQRQSPIAGNPGTSGREAGTTPLHPRAEIGHRERCLH
jgi:hypothetical protein